MGNPAEITHLLRPGATPGASSGHWPRPVQVDEAFSVLAVCNPGSLEDRLRKAARSLRQDMRFARAFPDALAILRERLYDIIVVAKVRNGMLARDFVREVRRTNNEAVVVIAAPCSEYEQLIEVMVEGAYDFLPEDADGHQLRLMLGRAMEHSRLRRRGGELERALDTQTSSLRQRLQELAMLNEMAQDMSSVPDLDEVLRRALRRALEAFESECGSFLIFDPRTEELVVRAAEGPGAEELIGLGRKLGEGISGKVARERSPVLVANVEKDSRFKSDALGPTGTRRYRSTSFIAVPLIHHGRLLGEMNITEKRSGEPFTPDDLRLLSILAGYVASAVNGAVAAEELKRANEGLTREICSARGDLQATGERLTRARSLADAIVSSLPAAVAAFDPDLTVTFANDAAKEMLDLAPGGSLTGHPARSELAGLANAAVEVMERGSTKRLASGSLRAGRDGRPADGCLNVVIAPLRLPDGSISGGTIIATPDDCPLIPVKET